MLFLCKRYYIYRAIHKVCLMLENKLMYSAVHHDRNNDLIFVWYNDGSRMAYKTKHKLYTPNQGEYGSRPCGMKDIYGKDMFEVIVDGKTEMDIRARHTGKTNHISECDIDFKTRWLQKHYEDVDDLRFDMKNFNICFLDIEVATKGKFPVASKADYAVNCVTIHFTQTSQYFTFGLNREISDAMRQKLLAEGCEYINCRTEYELLTSLFTTIGNANVDILTGWNCLSGGSNIWARDRIVPISKIKTGDTLSNGDIVDIHVKTGFKQINRILLSDGTSIESSSKHIFPAYVKHKDEYKSGTSILDTKVELTVENIIEKINDGFDVYLEKQLHVNTNNAYTYKQYVLDNLKSLLEYDTFDVVITDCFLGTKIPVDRRGSRARKLVGENDWKSASNKYSFKQNMDVISYDELYEMLSTQKTSTFLFNSHSYTFELDSVICDGMLRALGLFYTDGSLDIPRQTLSFYNKDINLIDEIKTIFHPYRGGNYQGYISTDSDDVMNVKCPFGTNPIGLLMHSLYNTDYTKNLDIGFFSKLSKKQFLVFFSACVDGDGWISKRNKSIGFCNFNDDISKFHDLLSWNGITSNVTDNQLRIKLHINNKDAYEINLTHPNKKQLLSQCNLITRLTRSSKSASSYVYDDKSLYKIKSITLHDDVVMYDIQTSSHYFNVSGVLTHNCDFFDNPYLINRAQQLGVDPRLLSRLPIKYRSAYMSKRDNTLKIGGTECIDFLKLYRKFTMSERDNYKLDTIGHIEVGERKAPLPDGYMSYIKYWDDFVWYNFKDTQLMRLIEDRRRMFETTIGACAEARVPFSAIFEAKKMLVGFIVNILHKKNLTMPPLKESDREWFPGAYVYSTPNYYDDLVSYDYRSMYPSIMMGANISPETKITFPIDYVVPADVLEQLVKSPWTSNGKRQVLYRKDKVGIVPEVVRILFDGRTELKNLMKKAKKAGNNDDAAYYNMKQNAYKIFGNSLYGLLGNPYFQLYDIDNSASVTAFGKELIQTTIKSLVHYIEHEFVNDTRYEKVFGHKPSISDDLVGTFINSEGETCYKRLSHGDTDSFFVRFEDIYSPWKAKVGKEVGVVVFRNSECIVNQSFPIEDEISAKKLFNRMCSEFSSSWSSMDADKKRDAFSEGYVTDGDYRIIYNRYILTDYCRILDATLLEEKLAEIMEQYAKHWNYYENTLFLKREKCIRQAIVTAKKKYICFVESNEDIKYFAKDDNGDFVRDATGVKTVEPEFAVTGLEIVRSSTTPFARERILILVTELLKNKDKQHIRRQYLELKREFYQLVHSGDWYSISIPSGVKSTPPVYTEWLSWPDDMKKKLDWRLRAGSVWNHLIEADPVLKDLGLEPIFESSKVKFIKVAPNPYKLNTVAYVGDNCHPRMWEIFTPDWDLQWEKALKQTMDRMFDAIGWGKNVENDDRELMLELF